MDCLSDETMAAIADGTLAPDERREAIVHVDACVNCRQVLAGVLTLDARPQGSSPVPRTVLSVGETIGRYVVLECIGSGSMGIAAPPPPPGPVAVVDLPLPQSTSEEAALGVVRARWGHAKPRSLAGEKAAALARTLGCR